MKVSLKWLKKYLDFDFDVNQMISKLIMAGLEIEELVEFNPLFENVKTSKIISVTSHPNNSELNICKVWDGKENIDLVCGASNIKENDIVPLASLGSIVQGKKIDVATIKGVISNGMLCSQKELNIGFDGSGVMILPATSEIGVDLKNIFDLKDIVLDVSITPNRGDCLSYRGIAREIAGTYGKKCNYPLLQEFKKNKVDFNIKIIDENFCPLYGGAILKDVEVKESPFDLKFKLFLSGIRSINNIVDITNYVLLDIGQPMHAFDLDKLNGNTIYVRSANEGENILTLDDINRKLKKDNFVIADSNRPIAVAGVMGGSETSVDENTKNIFFESAFFDPVLVRRTSKDLNLSSDSSYRFERGVDFKGIEDSLKIACALSNEYANASIINPKLNLDVINISNKIICLRSEYCNKILGVSFDKDQINNILNKIEIKNIEGDKYIIPGFRNDLEREIDLVEEVARVYGYDNIPEINEIIEINKNDSNELYKMRNDLSLMLSKLSLREVVNYSFVGEKDLIDINGFLFKNTPFIIENPLRPDQSVMRNSLIPGLLKTYVNSKNYKINNIKLFEIGSIFEGNCNLENFEKSQNEHLGIILGGIKDKSFIKDLEEEFDYFDIKGILNELFLMLHVEVNYKKFEHEIFEFSSYLYHNDILLGIVGALSPELCKLYSCKDKVYVAEISINKLMDVKKDKIKYKPIQRLPFITQDMSFIIDDKITHEEITKAIEIQNIDLIEDITIFDMYKGKNIDKGKKSLAYSIRYRDCNKTLTIDEVNVIHDKIKNKLIEDFKIEFR